MRKIFHLSICFFTFALNSCDKKGCTDVTALNYGSEAQSDDESCLYEASEVLGDLSWKVTIN